MEKEDAHFCLRCRITILGLDEYVAHRKADVCRQQQQQEQLEAEVCRQQQQLEADVCRRDETEATLFIPQSQDDGETQERLASSHFSTTTSDTLASEAAFMESIGLYLNPKPSKILGLMSPRSAETSESKNIGSASLSFQEERDSGRDDWEDLSKMFSKSKTSPLPDIDAGGPSSKSDFLRQMDLMNVDQNQVFLWILKIYSTFLFDLIFIPTFSKI